MVRVDLWCEVLDKKFGVFYEINERNWLFEFSVTKGQASQGKCGYGFVAVVVAERYGILVLFIERSIFRTAEKHGILVPALEHSNYLPHTRGMLV